MARDYRSPEAEAYRRLYRTTRWRSLRLAQLREHPLCARCARAGRVTPATEVHHTTPHKGDPALFFGGDLQSLCKPCHDGPAQSAERRGYSTEIGHDGFPVDPRHPANRG